MCISTNLSKRGAQTFMRSPKILATNWVLYELLSKLLVSRLLSPIVVPYIIPYITPL